MSNYILSTYMGFNIPIAGVDPGPDYANTINNSFATIDSHNHVSGSGQQIPVAGLNVSANLPINNNSLTKVQTINFQAQSGTLAGSAPNLGCIYVASADLYYNDESGNIVRITSGGALVGTAGSISGLPSGTAGASYGSSAYSFYSATNTLANIYMASAILSNNSANSKTLTLSPPAALGANYSLVFPAIPGVQSIMALDTSGNMSAPYTVDNSTIVIASNIIKVPSQGITSTQIANATITSTQIASATITNANLAGSITQDKITMYYGTNFVLNSYSTQTCGGTANVLVGPGSNSFGNLGSANTLVGNSIYPTGGAYNTLLGYNAGGAVSGGSNTCVGAGAGSGLSTGVNNIFVGASAGSSVVGGSNNIIIGYDQYGSSGDNSKILLGTSTQYLAMTGGSTINLASGTFTVSSATLTVQTSATVTIGGSSTLNISGGQSLTMNGNTVISGIYGQTAGTSAFVYCNSSGQLTTSASSREYKQDIIDLNKEIDTTNIYKLRPVAFAYKTHPLERTIGMIAEETHEIFPQLSVYKEGKVDAIAYQHLPILMLAEMQKMRKEIDELKAKLSKV